MRALPAAEIGIPRHRWEAGSEDTFALSSHARAREALDLALSIGAPGFNVYVLGEDRTGRMSATVAYLGAICTAARSRRKDWIYLQNYRDARQPLAFGLAIGDGARFSEALRRYVSRLRSMLIAALESDAHRERIKRIHRTVDEQINERQAALARAAEEVGFVLEESSEGVRLRQTAADTPDRDRNHDRLSVELDQLEREAGQLRASAESQALALDRQTLAGLIEGEVADFAAMFADYPALSEWIDDLTEEMIRDVRSLGRSVPEGERLPAKYCTNLLVDHSRADECVVLEPNPTYENLFGYHRVSPGRRHVGDRPAADPTRRPASRQWRRPGAARRTAGQGRDRLDLSEIGVARRRHPHRRAASQRRHAADRDAASGPDPARLRRSSSSARRTATTTFSAMIRTSRPISRSRPTSIRTWRRRRTISTSSAA